MDKLYYPFETFNQNFQNELNVIKKINAEKNQKYGKEGNFFSSFQLIWDLGIMPIENFLVMRGILDKFNRIVNLKAKKSNAVSWEGIKESVYDMVGYALLLHAYLQCRKNNKFDWNTALGNIESLISYIMKTFVEKNSDYSSKTTDEEAQKKQNAIENFVIVEKCWLSTTEDGIMARIAIKVQRIINLLVNKADEKSLWAEILDFIVYCLILNLVLDWKALPSKTNS